MIVIGHRGSGANSIVKDAPYRENTLGSLHAALAGGADGVEFDVRKSSDGQLVLFHDPKLQDRDIASLTYDEMLSLQSNMPLFSEVIDTVSERFILNVEIKDPAAAKEAVFMLKRRKNFYVTSFLGRALKETKAANPSIRTGLILGGYPKDVLKDQLPSLKKSLPFADFLVVEQHYLPFFRQIKKPLWTWSTQTEKQALRAKRAGAKVIITDHIERFR